MMQMVKRIVFGVVWFVVFYLSACFIGGGIAGGIAASKLGKNANATTGAAAGARAGEEFGKKYVMYILFLSATFAGIGTVAGILPGTRSGAAATPGQADMGPSHAESIDAPVGLTQTGNLHRRSIDGASDQTR
jgi:hypothetical protein